MRTTSARVGLALLMGLTALAAATLLSLACNGVSAGQAAGRGPSTAEQASDDEADGAGGSANDDGSPADEPGSSNANDNGSGEPEDPNDPDDSNGDGTPGAGLPCISCHSAAMRARRPVVDGSGGGAHSLLGDALSNDDCLVCHDLSQHMEGNVRLWADPAATDDVIVLHGDGVSPSRRHEHFAPRRYRLHCLPSPRRRLHRGRRQLVHRLPQLCAGPPTGRRGRRRCERASARSAGTTLDVRGTPHTVAELTPSSFDGVDLAFFSAGGSTSRQFAPIAAEAGALLVDNSSAFRTDDGVPLVVPEINPQAIARHRGIIANPNCSTIIMVMAVWPLHRVNPVRRIVVNTYQAASGAGAAAMRELEEQSRARLDGQPVTPCVFPFPIAFNLFSHNSAIDETGYNAEEVKMVRETRKIFGAPDLAVTATCVRVPVFRAHTASVNLTFERPISPDQARELLQKSPGIRVVDDRDPQHFPMPIEASGADEVLVGRIRQDVSQPDGRGIDLLVSGDQLRKGAALNAIQIAELLPSRC